MLGNVWVPTPASQRGENSLPGRYVFARQPSCNHMLVNDLSFWNWAWRQTLSDYKGVYTKAVRMDEGYIAPKTSNCTRNWSSRGLPRSSVHEAIFTNVILTLGAELVDPDPSDPDLPANLRAPTMEELGEAFRRMGSAIGISPFKREKGYGRFTPICIITASGEFVVGREHADGGAGCASTAPAVEDKDIGDRASPAG